MFQKYFTRQYSSIFWESIVDEYEIGTAWKLSKYGAFSGPYFPVFGLNTGKYGPEKTPYMDTFHTVRSFLSYYSKLLK